MNELSKRNWLWIGAALCIVLVLMAEVSSAQTTTTEFRKGEVVYVSGNDLVVRLDDGQVKQFTIPDDARFKVDGKDVSVHELKAGTKLAQTIMTTSTPRVVTSVRTVKGTVWNVNPPYVIVTLADGTNKQYKVPEGTKFDIQGQEKSVFELRKGMHLTATITRTTPETEVTRTTSVTGRAPAPPRPPATPVQVGVLLVEEAPAPRAAASPAPAPAPKRSQAADRPAAEETKPAKLPKTASPVPAIGMIGAIALSAGLLLRAGRRRSA
jgi:hypothetical protein